MRKDFITITLLLLVTCAYGQHYRRVDKYLNTFYKLNPINKITFFFNQPIFAAGDTAYFLMRVVNAVDLRPAKKKSTWHLVLVDKKGNKALDQFFLVEDGVASNQIILPRSLPPEIYRLLCFREPMVDPGKDLFYQQDFEIAGAYKYSLSDTIQSTSFFPEGGTILEGVQNKIFVSIRPARSVTLKIKDNLNKEVASLKTNSLGTGFFYLTPNEGETFYLSGHAENDALKVPLPSKKPGLNFTAIIIKGKLKLTGTATGVPDNLELMLLKNDRVCYAEKLILDNSHSFTSEIALGEILSGLFQLWLLDKNSLAASRILYYNSDPESEVLKIKHRTQVHPREKLEIQIDKSDSLMDGTYAVRVFQKALFQSDNRNIFSTLEFYNDLPPEIARISTTFSFDSINDFLATQQWQRYDIDSLLHGKLKTGKVNFDQPYQIRGKITGVPRLTQQLASVTLYFEGSNFIEESHIDKEGNFRLNLTHPITLTEKVYYRIDANEKELADARLEINEPTKFLPSIQMKSSKEKNPYFSYKKLKDSIETSYGYSASRQNLDRPTLKGLEAKSYGADNVYTLSDYNTSAFTSMKDIVVEILSKAKLRIIDGKNSVRVLLEDPNSKSPMLAKGDPLFIIDGIPSHSSYFFFALQPSLIERIKIIWKLERSVLKSFGQNGVIIVETKGTALSSAVPALYSFNLSGFSTPLSFNSPESPGDNRIPYFKSGVYWNPLISFTKEGKCKLSFIAPDDLGEYVIEVEGLSSDGAPFIKRSLFVVTKEN